MLLHACEPGHVAPCMCTRSPQPITPVAMHASRHHHTMFPCAHAGVPWVPGGHVRTLTPCCSHAPMSHAPVQAFTGWREVMDGFGGRLLGVAGSVARCLALGLGLPQVGLGRVA